MMIENDLYFSARGIQLPAHFLRRLKLQLKNYIPLPDYLFRSRKSTFVKINVAKMSNWRIFNTITSPLKSIYC